MKKLNFEDSSAQKVYDSYIRRIERTVRSLSKPDQKEVIMELNSHIYAGLESARAAQDDELNSIIKITDQLGDPEIILSSLVEEKSLERASRTFNPLHIAKALILNISNGIVYTAYLILYFALALCVFILGLKLFFPDRVGFLVSQENGDWIIGSTTNTSYQDVLGHWFIPAGLAVLALLYILLTLSMRLRRKKK